ncbi:hypothetical protein EC968_006885 [Mortierella alpina]|nr:hypothetical protein EC968_006885 [Mortierella alpina]
MVTATQHEHPQNANYWSDPVVGAMLQKDQCIAVALLVSGELDKLDPPIGDSSCQVRALLILILYHQLHKQIGATDWEDAVGLCKDCLRLHGVNSGGSVKNALQARKRTIPYKEDVHLGGDVDNLEFQAFVTLVREKLGEQRFELLGLAYSLWSGGIVSTDEFWIDFRYRSNNLWGQHERRLRARLAKLSCAEMINLASELPAADKWVELLKETKSVIKRGDAADQEEEENVEVLCAQSTFNVALAALYYYNIPIVDGNVRIQLTGADGCDHGKDHHLRCEDCLLHRLETDNASFCKSGSCKTTYSLGTVRTLLYVPNKMTGAFEFVRNPSKEQMIMPCFFLKTWSTYHGHSSSNYNYTGSNKSDISKDGYYERDDLYSPDHGRYYEALLKIDKSWAIEVMASTHPPFTRRAQHADLDIAPVYERIFGRSRKEFQYNRYGFEGENFLTPKERQHLRQEKRQQQQQQQQQDQLPTPTDRLIMARRVSHERQLSGECQFVRMGAPSKECTWRITRTIDWNVVHVHAATFKWVDKQLQALACRHQEAVGAVIGRFVFSQGTVGASHECMEAATKLHNTQQSKARMKLYLAVYPKNQPLLRR